jgi:hypothetical protein
MVSVDVTKTIEKIISTKKVFIFDWDDTLCCFKSLTVENIKSKQIKLDD